MHKLFEISLYHRGQKVGEVDSLHQLPSEVRTVIMSPHDGDIDSTINCYQNILPIRELGEEMLRRYGLVENDLGVRELIELIVRIATLNSDMIIAVVRCVIARLLVDPHRIECESKVYPWCRSFVRPVGTEDMMALGRRYVFPEMHRANLKMHENLFGFVRGKGGVLWHAHTMLSEQIDFIPETVGPEGALEVIESRKILGKERPFCYVSERGLTENTLLPGSPTWCLHKALQNQGVRSFTYALNDPFFAGDPPMTMTEVSLTRCRTGFFDVPRHFLTRESRESLIAHPWSLDIDNEYLEIVGAPLAEAVQEAEYWVLH